MKKIAIAMSSCAVIGLSACGGGGGDEGRAVAPAPTSEVPASASQSVSGLVDYLAQLVRSSPDDREALSLAGFDPKTSESAAPVSLK